jgi:hypothetical protein
MFEGYYSPPLYLDLYNFGDGAQDDIFENGVVTTLPNYSSTGRPAASPVPSILNVQATSIHTTPSSFPTSAPDSVNPTSPTHGHNSSQNHSSSPHKHKHTLGGSCRARHK